MKKMFKHTILFTTLFTVVSSNLPAVTVLANEHNTDQHLAITQVTPKQMSEREKELFIEEVKQNHPTVSESFIREALERQLVGDYSIPRESPIMFRSAWQGVTVDQMGALIDVALGTLLGAGVGGLTAAITKVGKHEAKTQLKKVLLKYGLLSGIISDKVLDYALNLTSPGYHIANYWDNHDKYPGNGRINFEW